MYTRGLSLRFCPALPPPPPPPPPPPISLGGPGDGMPKSMQTR